MDGSSHIWCQYHAYHRHSCPLFEIVAINNWLLLNMFDHSPVIVQSIQYQKKWPTWYNRQQNPSLVLLVALYMHQKSPKPKGVYRNRYRKLSKVYLIWSWFNDANQAKVFGAKFGSLNKMFGNCNCLNGFRYVWTFFETKISPLSFLWSYHRNA